MICLVQYGSSTFLIQDLDPKPGFGAFWGEVNTNIHKGLGAQGVVTNGSIRDLADLGAATGLTPSTRPTLALCQGRRIAFKPIWRCPSSPQES